MNTTPYAIGLIATILAASRISRMGLIRLTAMDQVMMDARAGMNP